MKRIVTPSTNRMFAADSQCVSGHLNVLKKSFATQHQLNVLQNQLAQSAAQPAAQQPQTNASAQASSKTTKSS